MKVFAFMLAPFPLLWCWHQPVHSAHPCSFWLLRGSLVLYWDSKWCQQRGRREGQSSLKARRAAATVSPPAAGQFPVEQAVRWGYGAQPGLWRRARQQDTCSGSLGTVFSRLHLSFCSAGFYTRELVFVLEYSMLGTVCTARCGGAPVIWTQKAREHQMTALKQNKPLR